MESEFLYLSWLLKHLLYLDILPISKFYLPRNYLWIPRWLSSKESACQCRRRGFYLWVGKIPWSSKYQPIPVFLPGKSHGQRSLVGYNPWACKESDMTEHTEKLPIYIALLLNLACIFM